MVRVPLRIRSRPPDGKRLALPTKSRYFFSIKAIFLTLSKDLAKTSASESMDKIHCISERKYSKFCHFI